MIEVVTNPAQVWAFTRDYISVPMSTGMHGIGLVRDGEMLAGVLYEGFTGHNIWMHVAAKPQRKWLNPAFIKTCFEYPFVQLGCKRVSGWVEASNTAARKLDEHLGFKPEAALKGAARDGGDVILYVMWREDCRYV